MKGFRNCHHESEDDDTLYHMTKVNKCTQRIMTDAPDQLTSIFSWTILTGLFIIILVGITCLVLKFESPENLKTRSKNTFPYELPVNHDPAEPLIAGSLKTRELCPALSKDLYSLEQMGYVPDTNRRMSKLMTLDINTEDVHYVLTNSTHVPRLFMCSLESAVNAVKNNSRVNVFVIHGIESQSPTYDGQTLKASQTLSLSDLKATHIGDRLNVVYIALEECLKGSPFQGIDLSNRFALAKFTVQLVLLWQYGGTVLENNMVVVGRKVYRASGSAVEYSDRMMSSPFPCHVFVYNAMLYAKNFAMSMFTKEYAMNFGMFNREIVMNTVKRARRAGHANEYRPVADGIVCRTSVTNNGCYYLEVDPVTFDNNNFVHDLCPTMSKNNRTSINAVSQNDNADDLSDDNNSGDIYN